MEQDGEPVLLCRRNVPVAEIRLLRRPGKRQRPIGLDRGQATVPKELFLPLGEGFLDRLKNGG